jgi:arylsulfatase A-like enzyme
VRDGDWKLIEWYEDPAPELFNLRDDLEEKHNIAAANPAKVKELQARLAAWRKEVGAVMPTPNPKYDPTAKPKKAAKQKDGATE